MFSIKVSHLQMQISLGFTITKETSTEDLAAAEIEPLTLFDVSYCTYLAKKLDVLLLRF